MAARIWWFVVFPASEHPGNKFPAGARIVSAQEGSPAYNAWTANGAYTIAGISWQVDAGPFPTKKQAQQWAPKPLSIVDWAGAAIAGVLVGAGNQQPAAAVPEGQAAAAAAPDALLGPLAAIGGSFEAFFTAVTDGKMWRSLGWILLGLALMYLGVALWLGPSAARRSPLGVARSVGAQVALCLPSRRGTGLARTSVRRPWRRRPGWSPPRSHHRPRPRRRPARARRSRPGRSPRPSSRCC